MWSSELKDSVLWLIIKIAIEYFRNFFKDRNKVVERVSKNIFLPPFGPQFGPSPGSASEYYAPCFCELWLLLLIIFFSRKWLTILVKQNELTSVEVDIHNDKKNNNSSLTSNAIDIIKFSYLCDVFSFVLDYWCHWPEALNRRVFRFRLSLNRNLSF